MRPFALVAGVVLALSVLIPIPEEAQGRTGQELWEEMKEHWRIQGRKDGLWAECRKIPTSIVYGPAEHSRTPYPTREDIEAILHSKLRAHHLDVESWKSIGVRLDVWILPMISLYEVESDVILTESEFHALNELVLIEFEFNKRVYDPWKQEHTYTHVWIRQRVVGAKRLRKNVTELMDEFIEDYLIYNDSDCPKNN